jgi:hypothetical protein
MGALERAGVAAGEINTYAEDNIRGNRELSAIQYLHDDILQRNGGAWDKPLKKLRWDRIHHVLLEQIVINFQHLDIWGFKDPRTLLSVGVWLRKVPELEPVGTFRHPLLVADSLHRRNGISQSDGLGLWLHYNLRLIWVANNHGSMPLIEFGADADDYRERLGSLLSALNLNSDNTGFFEPSLQHAKSMTPEDGPIYRRCMRVYGQLQALSTQGQQSDLCA